MKRLVPWACAVIAVAAVWMVWSEPLQFALGGAMINAGYRMQDSLARYDFQHEHANPEEVWAQFLGQNRLSSSIRWLFPRTARHPVVAIVACMDGRLDTNEIAGDTRRYYYVLRLAGSVLSPKEEEMLELAVENGVEVVVFTTHTDCAAEKVAADPAARERYPHLSKAVDERAMRFQEFLERPMIAKRLTEGLLLVKWMDLDTKDESLMPHAMSAR